MTLRYKTTSRSKILAILAVLALAAWLAGAQEPASVPREEAPADGGGLIDEVFVDQINVNVVNVDVYVTDKKGNPITDLTADDFELFENRKPVAITNFLRVEGGKRVELPVALPAAEPVAEGEAPPPPEPVPPAAVENDDPLHLVVYIDNQNIRPINRNRVMGDLRRFLLEEIERDDRVMLITYDRSLKVEQPFTNDLRLLAGKTFEIEKRSGGGVLRDSEREQAITLIDDADTASQAISYARSFAQSVENDLTFTLRALKEITESLGGLPGRKAMLYVSDGLPMVAGQDLFLAVDEKFGSRSNGTMESFNFDFNRRFKELTQEANANRVTIYTLDAQGLLPPTSVSAEYQGRDVRFAADRTRLANLQSSLRFMANETGGVAIVNTNNAFPVLQRISQDFGTYYSLGYQPAHFGDGRYYNIEVKLKDKGRKGLVVRHREGYRDHSPETRMNDGTVAALYYTFENNPLGIKLDFAAETRRDDGFYLVPVEVRIPIGNIAMIPREGTHEGRLKLYVGALDDKGRTSPVQQMPVAVSIPNDRMDHARTQDYVYTVTLLMRSGSQRVAVGVRDELAAQEAFLQRQVIVGNPRRG
jgi:VWFA-related protein